MSKEFEIALNLIRRVMPELESLASVEDKLTARRIVNAIFNPVVASAYQAKVGDGPRKEELEKVLVEVVSCMRDLSDLEALRSSVKKLLSLVKEIEELASTPQGKENA